MAAAIKGTGILSTQEIRVRHGSHTKITVLPKIHLMTTHFICLFATAYVGSLHPQKKPKRKKNARNKTMLFSHFLRLMAYGMDFDKIGGM